MSQQNKHVKINIPNKKLVDSFQHSALNLIITHIFKAVQTFHTVIACISFTIYT